MSDCGERMIGISPTGELPDVKPSSAELCSAIPGLTPFPFRGGLLSLRHRLEDVDDPAEESTDVFIKDDGEIPPPELEQDTKRGTWLLLEGAFPGLL